MIELIDEAKQDLIAAEWSIDRVYDISRYEDYYKEKGYVINDIIREVLRNFGGLHFTTPAYNGDGRDTVHFDAIDGVDSFSFHDTLIFEKYTNGPVLPIGECCSENVTTLMAHSGKIYGFYACLYYLGDDIFDFINRLYHAERMQKRWQIIDVPEMDQS